MAIRASSITPFEAGGDAGRSSTKAAIILIVNEGGGGGGGGVSNQVEVE